MNLGNVSDTNTTTKLYCNLMPHGWRLVRRGWREGLDKTKAPIWTFCPLLSFPRDRILCIDCKKCSHYRGMSRDLDLINRPPIQETLKPFRILEKKTVLKFTEEQIKKAIDEEIASRRKWEEEEKNRSEME